MCTVVSTWIGKHLQEIFMSYWIVWLFVFVYKVYKVVEKCKMYETVKKETTVW